MGCRWPAAPPSVFQANERRWWLLVTSLVENLFFSAVLLGWSSLLAMLKSEGFYKELCFDRALDLNRTATADGVSEVPSLFLNDTTAAQLAGVTPQLSIVHGDSGDMLVLTDCTAQDAKLNLCFTVGSFLLSAVTFPLGIVMDKFGSRRLRMVAAALHGLSYLLLLLPPAGSDAAAAGGTDISVPI